ncbi:MAG TPA: hypothetical protein VNO52_01240 [Methylomirabilota bacterium]|nr:hypothetical protein [Methylomirabilota bacterium]
MNRKSRQVAATALVILSGSAPILFADRPNPYQAIIDRNVFGLNPPPPPVDTSQQEAPPPAPLATVKMTGLHNMFNKPKVLLEITPAPGKQPIKDILEVGDRREGIEVLAINIAKSEVTIKNGHVTTNLQFEVLKSAAAPAAATAAGFPGAPGGALPGKSPVVPIVNPPPAPVTDAGPTPVSSISTSRRNSIVLSGANAPEPEPTAPAAVGSPSTPTGPQPAGSGFRALPSRQPRTPLVQPQMSAEQNYEAMNRLREMQLQEQAARQQQPPQQRRPGTGYVPPLPPMPPVLDHGQ